ncbi:DUF2384 domain-containing protein [Dyella sp. M7H15-1]|uniref:type II RES/Xre toxin-antitoxin system antitoxin n=1 Tax=Dyella sp. M7H15-1 TaxID=2501295 RepID=UPI001004FC0D|nr:antitoxin Xre/MbcA/ParS toxin-binding domain-containing protein [Dyella sp. M7H15-1]QAU24822.1 DUF2384 domain-containing protein [Dyella sp. M7H15-1]
MSQLRHLQFVREAKMNTRHSSPNPKRSKNAPIHLAESTEVHGHAGAKFIKRHKVGKKRQIVMVFNPKGWDRVAERKERYVELFQSPPLLRAELVKAGMPAKVVKTLAQDMKLEQVELLGFMGVTKATFNRRLQDQKPLDLPASERVLGVMRLVGQVEKMVQESGDPEGFDASAWIGHWLEQPLPALGGEPPSKYMDTSGGQELVSQLLAQAQSGAYA